MKDIAKTAGNEYAALVSDGVEAGDVDSFIDTGSYIFNALLSGSINGGLASNKITAIAGESATGKTFFILGMVKSFLDANPEAGVLYLNKYLETPEGQRVPMMLCLDSLGMLSTTKEVEDTAEGKETKDMTRAQIVKATFRVLTLKLGRAKVPMIVTNHTYDVVGSMFPTKEMGGGSGLKYAASSIVYLSKKKEKDGTAVVGNIIHCKNAKSRLTIEHKMVDVRLMYERGLDRYYGLLELAIKYDIFKSVSTRIELPDGTKTFGKTINNNPEKYFTEDIMQQLDVAAGKEFKYGRHDPVVEDTPEDEPPSTDA